MNTFKKKVLYAALTGLGVMSMAGSAQAVNLNPNGLGQVLIYPYYTVRGDANGVGTFNSLISVVNKTNVGKAVKVRFLEGKASQEILDFNLYLSPKDVWTGAIIPTADGSGAMLTTTDKSCTAPAAIPAAGQPFVNYMYLGDLADQTLDRTKEGYIEIIEMANIPSLDVNGQPNNTLAAITHANGVPANCAAIIDNNSTPFWVGTDLYTGDGGLFGSMTLISVNEAQDVAYEAVALDSFFTGPGLGGVPGYGAANTLWFPAGNLNPNLGHANPKMSTVVNGTDEYITSWDEGIDAVSAVLMNESVYNEYALDDSIAAKTDWVITFPTKWQYYDAPNNSMVRPLKAGYTLFQRDFGANGACDDFDIAYYDREERRVSPTEWGGLPPPPPALCWGANVMAFSRGANTASIFHAQNRFFLPAAFDNGWAELTFRRSIVYHLLTAHGNTQHIDLSTSPPVNTNAVGYVYHGLPMVGFAVQQFNNNEVASAVVPGTKVWASYAGRIAHRFDRNITLP